MIVSLGALNGGRWVVSAALGYPAALPQRRRRSPSTLPDWTDEEAVRTWVFKPVPVPLPPLSPELFDAAERAYRWMLAAGWGRTGA